MAGVVGFGAGRVAFGPGGVVFGTDVEVETTVSITPWMFPGERTAR